jgi:hypothetical protein
MAFIADDVRKRSAPELARHLPMPPRPHASGVEDVLNTRAGSFVERHAGDACSLLGIVGAAGIVASWTLTRREPMAERIASRFVLASMGAAALDTAIQSYNHFHDDGRSAAARGNHRSDWGTIGYAATGLIPAATYKALRAIGHKPTFRDVTRLSVLALAAGVMGYELIRRGPGIARDLSHSTSAAVQDGEFDGPSHESLSGYGSFAAAIGGFVVARHGLKLSAARIREGLHLPDGLHLPLPKDGIRLPSVISSRARAREGK